MRRFLASAWFPFLIVIVLAGGTVAAFALLKPSGSDLSEEWIFSAFRIAGWAAGPAAALLSLLVIAILNLIRRIVRLRKVRLLHPVTVLLGVGPWLVASWMILDEPRFTPFAIGTLDFVARPLLWGSLAACVLTIVLSLPLLIPSRS